jgi:3-oxoacyl-[acyl-carrier-protein] synthase-3
MGAVIKAISSYLPSRVVTNEELAAEFSGWTAGKIAMKTGILSRHIAAEGELASDLAVHAVTRLFEENGIGRDSVDALLYCTQSPDYLLPPTACILQHRLELPRSVAAFDFNLGCSGFVYGLGLAKGLIASGQARRILLVTADTYSRYLHPRDRSVRTLFGDAAAAVCIDAEEGRDGMDGPFVYGTDGSGAENLMVPAGGLRCPVVENPEVITDSSGNQRTAHHLFMNGPEIFTFTLRVVPETVAALLHRTGLGLEDIDLFVFHQANEYMLEHLRKRLDVPAEKFVVSMQDCGNTVSSTIPIALERAMKSGRLQRGMRVMLLGFGVGYSWAGTIICW